MYGIKITTLFRWKVDEMLQLANFITKEQLEYGAVKQ